MSLFPNIWVRINLAARFCSYVFIYHISINNCNSIRFKWHQQNSHPSRSFELAQRRRAGKRTPESLVADYFLYIAPKQTFFPIWFQISGGRESRLKESPVQTRRLTEPPFEVLNTNDPCHNLLFSPGSCRQTDRADTAGQGRHTIKPEIIRQLLKEILHPSIHNCTLAPKKWDPRNNN